MEPQHRPDATAALTAILSERIMVLDGAMGTAIQRDRPDEAGYRGERFADHPSDLIGNNDLLTLTQPDLIRAIHEDYLAAGADIIETNTFNANAISLSDYGLEELDYELNHQSARLARRAADAAATRRPPALGGRRPRPDDPDGLHLARRERPGRAQRVVRPARRRLPRRRTRSRRRRRRPADDRDDLRHPQRQGGDLRRGDAVRGAGAPLAGHHLRHDHRRVRSYALGPGHRSVLGLDPPRPPAGRRPQLRPRRTRHAPLRRRAVAARRLVRQRLPQRRPAQRLRGVRRDARPDGRGPRGVRRRRLPQPRRRVLRHHARPHRRHRRRGRGQGPSRARDHRAGDATVRSRAADDHRGQPLRQRRRAHQHHRLRPLPQADQGRRLRRRPRRGCAAGRVGRTGHRRQHGRGDDRRGRGHGPLPQAHRGRARHQPRAGDGRLLQVGGHRGRPQVRAGQGDRQLDLHEGGRGAVPRARPAVPQVRRRRRRDGVRRGRPGRQPRAAQGHLRAGLPDPRRRGRLPARGHHLRPQRLRRRHRHRGARHLRPGLHRGHPLDQAEPPRREGQRRHLQRLVLLPGQQPGS